jgi:hypothetical protein
MFDPPFRGPRPEQLLECVQARVPVVPVAFEPCRGAVHLLDHDAAPPLPSGLLADQEARLLEHPEVLRDGGQRDVERGRERADVRLPLRERDEDAAAGRVRERREDGVERRGRGSVILNHKVKRHRRLAPPCQRGWQQDAGTV